MDKRVEKKKSLLNRFLTHRRPLLQLLLSLI